MAQQTAVNFLLRELRIEDLAKGEQLSVVLDICEQAKQMEKEQIVKAHGLKYYDLNEEVITGEQYYNETFTSTPQDEIPSAKEIGQS